MAAIWKYPLSDLTNQKIQMPVGAKILSVQVQHSTPTIWALVDPSSPTQDRRFRVIGTGWDFDPAGLIHVSTWSFGGFVWHLFEETQS